MINVLDRLTNSHPGCLDFFVGVYVFGSILWSDNPNDIDLLLVYETPKLALVSSANERVKSELSEYFAKLPIHLTVLNESEFTSCSLLAHQNHIRIK